MLGRQGLTFGHPARELDRSHRRRQAPPSAPAISVLVIWPLLALAGACRRPVPPRPYVAFVLNNRSATLAAVNLADFRVLASLSVAPEAERVVVRPGHSELYIVSPLGRIDVVSFPNPRVIATLQAGRSARALAFSPDGREAYVLDPAERALLFVDCEATKVTGRVRFPSAVTDLALSGDGKTLVVASADAHNLTFLAAETRRTLGAVELGKAPGPMVILPDRTRVFVADIGEAGISAVDIGTEKLLSHIEFGLRPTNLLLKPDGGEIFALDAQATHLVIVDTYHANVEQTLPTGRGLAAGVFRRDSSLLYLANAGDGTVTALDVETRQVLASTRVGVEPRALALTPDERFLVVADSATSSLAILRADPPSLAKARSMLITTVGVGSKPVDVVVPDWLGG